MTGNERGPLLRGHRQVRSVSACLLALALAATAPSSAAAAGESVFNEYQVKAAFIKNIVKFVAWPPGTPGALTLCLLDEDPFGGAFSGRSDLGDGRSLAGRRIGGAQESGECQILFVPSANRAALPEILDALGTRPVLTIGDGEGMAKAGLAFSLLVEAQKVRFEANLAPVRRAGLTASSRLLGLAKTVHNAQ
jgi:hypothetical protein